MKFPIELRESPHDEKTVSFSLIVSKSRAPALRHHLESLIALLSYDQFDDMEEGGLRSKAELPSQVLKRLRQERGLPQKAVAQYLGVSQGRISDLEQGVKKISLEEAQKLATYFQVSTSLFLS